MHCSVRVFSDVKFMVGHNKKAIYAHKYILAARCEVFRAMFTDRPVTAAGGSDHDRRGSSALVPTLNFATAGRTDDAPIILEKITPDVFLAMLEFIYTNCCTLNAKIVCYALHSLLY